MISFGSDHWGGHWLRQCKASHWTLQCDRYYIEHVGRVEMKSLGSDHNSHSTSGNVSDTLKTNFIDLKQLQLAEHSSSMTPKGHPSRAASSTCIAPNGCPTSRYRQSGQSCGRDPPPLEPLHPTGVLMHGMPHLMILHMELTSIGHELVLHHIERYFRPHSTEGQSRSTAHSPSLP